MFTWQRLSNCLLLSLFTCAAAFAQERAVGARPGASPPVTVATAGAGVRFTAVGAVERMRLEVFDSSGTPVFDTGFRPGNVRDWRLTGAHGERPIGGTYLCVVTVKEVSGRLSFKQGSVMVEDGQASLALEGSGRPERVEAEQAFSERSPAEPAALTAVTHDGEVGQVTSTAGALTFRTGDLFTGRDTERLRITEDGKVGIGTDDPQSTLDVAGAIRARGGIRFEDGTVLTSTGRAGRTNADGTISDGPTPSVSGAGTTGRLTKWTDGPAEVLGDSVVTELSGRLGVATATPRARLDIKQSADSFVGGLHLRRSTTNDTWALVTGSDNNLYVGYATDASGADAGGDFTTFPLVLSATNRVGIGTTAPAAKLHVNGNVNFTGLRTEATASTPNVVGGFGGNAVTAGVAGATISGGGAASLVNRVTDDFGTVGGGWGNRAGDGAGATNDHPYATVGGGVANIASGSRSTIGGGSDNAASGFTSTIGGGQENIASAMFSTVSGGVLGRASGPDAAVGGGRGNHAEGPNSIVGGGGSNVASGDYSTIGGGLQNQTTGSQSTVPGGSGNRAHGHYSFAAGRRAEAVNPGAFVWADSTDASFGSTADNQFLIRAGGGVGIGTNSPRATLGLVASSGNANLFMRAAATPTRGINFGVDGSAPNARLFIAQYNGTTYQDRLVINSDGTVSVNVLAAATGTHLCVNGAKLANCSSSLRYKERVVPFNAGLNLLSRLRPVTFKWKEREEQDLGLIAEEVNRVEPLLVTRDSAGKVQGVKYDQLSVVLINAIREQQGQLERQRKQIEDLKRLVCLTSPGAEVCR